MQAFVFSDISKTKQIFNNFVSYKILYGERFISLNIFIVESSILVAVLVPVFIVFLIAVGVAGFIFYRFVLCSKNI